MAHAQQQVLDLIKSILVAGGTAAGARVFVDRVDALQPHELPAIQVDEAPDGEQIQPYTIHGVDQRELTVTVNCVVAHGSAAAEQARDLGLAVEKLLSGSQPLAAMCQLGVQIGSSRLVISGEQDRLMAEREQAWRFSYLARSADPSLIL